MNTFLTPLRAGMVVATLAIGALTAAAAAYADTPYDGTLDPTLDPIGGLTYFGIPGLYKYGLNLGGGSPYINDDTATAVAVQVDGKIIVAGFAWNTYLSTDQNACVLARFNADGTLDTGFAGTGRIISNFTPQNGANDCYLSAVALQGDGKIVAVGNIHDSAHGDRGIVFRYNANGSPDNSFNNGTSGNHVLAGDNSAFTSVAIASDGTIFTGGYSIQGGHTDEDFFYEAWAGDTGNAEYWDWAAFNLGGSGHEDDRAYALVLQEHVSSCPTALCLVHDEMYLVGSADNTPYGDGLGNHDCAIAAYFRTGNSPFSLDTGFNGSGRESIDFPAGAANEGDNICRAAVARSPSGGGLVIGGENYFISTLGGGTPGIASQYALAVVDANGAATRKDLSISSFQQLPFPGIYNGIFAMAWQPDGKLLVAGYAGTDDSQHQPADAGVIRYNPDFSLDFSFGPNVGGAQVILSLDGEDSLAFVQREWIQGMALDNRGHIVVAGERSLLYPGNDYDWMIGRLSTEDEIFRDGLDGVVPPLHGTD
jgi:uncharacterized delta-60 repeat protein